MDDQSDVMERIRQRDLERASADFHSTRKWLIWSSAGLAYALFCDWQSDQHNQFVILAGAAISVLGGASLLVFIISASHIWPAKRRLDRAAAAWKALETKNIKRPS
jgi:uncharacterized iron-regulated membrane protein